jgi:hypothetical protein
MHETLDKQYQTISPEDMNLFRVTDDVDEAVNIVHDHCTGKHVAGKGLPRFQEDEEAEIGEGTRGGIRPRRGGRLRESYRAIQDDEPAI